MIQHCFTWFMITTSSIPIQSDIEVVFGKKIPQYISSLSRNMMSQSVLSMNYSDHHSYCLILNLVIIKPCRVCLKTLASLRAVFENRYDKATSNGLLECYFPHIKLRKCGYNFPGLCKTAKSKWMVVVLCHNF